MDLIIVILLIAIILLFLYLRSLKKEKAETDRIFNPRRPDDGGIDPRRPTDKL